MFCRLVAWLPKEGLKGTIREKAKAEISKLKADEGNKDEDDLKQTDADSIKIGSFTLNPAEFYLYSGNAIDIYVNF